MALQPSPHPRRYIPRRSSASQSHEAYAFPSPTRGLDASQPLPGGNPTTALTLNNLIPRAMGCILRKGYTRWVSNMESEIRSMMQYHPPSGNPRLFAANAAGKVFEVTNPLASSVIPSTALTVSGGNPAGEWTSLNYVSDTAGHFLVMVNPGGGYWTFNGTTWVEHIQGTGVGQIEGVDPKTFNFVSVFKRHLVFTQTGTTDMWFLPAGQISGLATKQPFGAILPNGGALAGLVNWTFDGSSAGGTGAAGGGGMDNKLIVIADQGDVLVYSGELVAEPSNFQLVGRWFVGRVPVGHRFFSQYAADVAIISERGLSFMTELMRGEGFFSHAKIAQQINTDLSVQVTETLDVRYWEVKFLPNEQLLVINLPEWRGIEDLQWALEVNNKAFCMLKGFPVLTVDPFNGRSFGGDYVGNVWLLFNGDTDGEVDDTPGKDLQGSVVTAFQALGEGVRIKRFLMVKPSFIANSPPGVQVRLNSEWNLQPPETSPPFLPQADSFWDRGLWDVAQWSGTGASYEAWTGAAGTGRYGSLAMRVRGAADTIFVGWQAVVEGGGIL